MDISRIFESIIITNEKLDGILARIEFLIGELEDEKSHLFFATQAHAPEHHIMSSEKKFNEFFTHHTREVRKAAIKPQLETMQEIVSIKNTVVEVLRTMKEAGVHLDLNINPSLAMPALTMVASLTNLMMLVFSPLLAPARIFHDIYQRLTQSNDDVIKELKNFMERYQPHPVDILQEELAAYQEMISTGATSAQKVLQRTRGQVESQLGNLLSSQEGMTTPDQFQPSALGHRDILQPDQVARVAFLSGLAVGTPWDANQKTGAGYEVIKTILTSGWVLPLHRHIVANLHSTIRNTVDRSKVKRGKQEKKKMISEWEKEALLKAPIERREQRRKLADILEKYCWLMEDQVGLQGPRIFLLLTLLSHAAYEVNWLVLHQNGEVKRKMEKESEDGMATDQETIRLLFYIVRLRDMLKASEDITRDYIVTSTKRQMGGLKEQEGVKLNELDLNSDWGDMLKKVQDGVDAIKRDVTDSGLHRYDLGRLITSLSSPNQITASSPAQSCPQLLITLEQVYLQMWILEGPVALAKHVSNMKVLYFFQDTFRDNFKHLLNRFDNIFSHAIAFPALCEDFVSVLHPECPEEYEEVLQETRNLANGFTDEIAFNSVKLVEKYCQLIINQERADVNIREAARLFHEKEADTKRKEQEKEKAKAKGKKGGSRRERSKTMKKAAKKRGALFSEPIEKMTIAMKELFNIFGSQPSLNVAGFTFRPTAAFQEKLYEKILDKTRALIALEGRTQDPVLPSLVVQGLNTYQAALTSIDPGLHFATMFQEALFSTRTDDPHPFLVKYFDKILGNLRSPQCFYCEPLACFVGLSKEMHITAHPIEKLTSAHELESLFEIFGVDGQLFMAQRLTQAISQQAGKVIELLTANSALLSDHEAREREGSWRGLQQIPGFLEATIDLGKLVALAELIDSALLSVTKDRVGFLEAAIDNICTSDMSRLLGVPDSILPIASAMGFPKVTGQGESGKFQADQLLIMTSVLLPFLARLETMRYYPHMTDSDSIEEPAPLLEVHHNSINCLTYALSYLRGEQESEGDSSSLLARYALPLGYVKPEVKDAGSGSLGTLLLALALLPQDCGVPFSVELSLKRSSMFDNSPKPEAATLQSEFEGKRISKLMKK